MAVVDLHHSRRPVESKTAQKTVNKPGQHRHLTRFLSRDLPQHKHADRARNLANLLARNCILSPPLARHPLTTCACVCVVVRLGHFCNPLALPPSRALSFSLSALFCSPFANRFAFFRIFLHLYVCNENQNFTHCAKCGSCQKFAKKYITSDDDDGDLLFPERGQRTTTTLHTIGGGVLLCEGTAHQPTTLTH